MSDEHPIRLLLSGELSFGPGKAELLEKIRTLGSVQAAAAEMGMSYMKAWKIVKGLNERFQEPLVSLSRGGKAQGGAVITPAGNKVLGIYHDAVKAAEKATAAHLLEFRSLLLDETRQ
ncbi:MAG: LysR family transcriptional regulator [Luteolibacter sp.]